MLEKLTRQEEQAMRAIWKAGEGSVKTFLDHIESPQPPYTTLASTVKNLLRKGYLQSRQVGNTYLYKPAIGEDEFTATSLTSLVKNHFANSYKDLVAFFASEQKISPAELKEIIDMIENKKV